MRLIDADALIEELEADAGHIESSIARMMHYAIIKDIEHAPTIDAAEVKRGKWLNMFGTGLATGMFDGVCSVCGEESEYLTPYCGNCGAKMDEVTE